MCRLLLVGREAYGNLESSYRTAFEQLGCQVFDHDLVAAAESHVPLGSVGRLLGRYISIEPWIQKANRDLIVRTRALEPDLVLVFGHRPVRVGALAQIRASTQAKLVHIWPDTLLNWNTHMTASLPLYDLVATYSQTTVPILQRLGARRVVWLPLAGDLTLHADVPQREGDAQVYGADVCFVGGWRPEREEVLSRLEEFDLKIWGPDWGRRCRSNRAIGRAWQGRALYGADFSRAVAHSKINLNIIDPTNYPAANMRFFEISTAGGLQVSSPCPEMAREFCHGEQVFYYHRAEELPGLIRALQSDGALCARVAGAAREKIEAAHTYVHRAQRVLQMYRGGFVESEETHVG
jgi:spore maturation protein CgeB